MAKRTRAAVIGLHAPFALQLGFLDAAAAGCASGRLLAAGDCRRRLHRRRRGATAAAVQAHPLRAGLLDAAVALCLVAGAADKRTGAAAIALQRREKVLRWIERGEADLRITRQGLDCAAAFLSP